MCSNGAIFSTILILSYHRGLHDNPSQMKIGGINKFQFSCWITSFFGLSQVE